MVLAEESEMIETADSATTRPCAGGHWFWYSGDPPDGKLPDGWPCQCGATRYDRRQAILDEIEALKSELEEV